MSDLTRQDLEIKLAFLERHVEEQDRALYQLHEELEALRGEVARLSERLASAGEGGSPLPTDERPPHY